MEILTKKPLVVRRSENNDVEFMYTPSILRLNSGKLMASYDVSDEWVEIKASEDKGYTWTLRAKMQGLHHARLFCDGDMLYIIGHSPEGVMISRSNDEGNSWEECSCLSSGEHWHGSACSTWYKDGYIYLVLEVAFMREGENPNSRPGWPPNILAPVVLRGKLGTDLTKRENWLFSNRVRYRDIVRGDEEFENFGIPFFKNLLYTDPKEYTANWNEYREKYDYENNIPGIGFCAGPTGWLEGNVVQVVDPTHYWYDPTGKTLHIILRSFTHTAMYGCVMKAVERVRDGKEVIDIEPVYAPSGKRYLFMPLPGGNMKFFIKYDEKTKLYWLVSSQMTNSMQRVECLPREWVGLPCENRNRLTLHFSPNLVDWIFAGLVDKGENHNIPRQYASMDIDGDDLLIMSRAGDADSHSSHDGNLILLHKIENFRNLVY